MLYFSLLFFLLGLGTQLLIYKLLPAWVKPRIFSSIVLAALLDLMLVGLWLSNV